MLRYVVQHNGWMDGWTTLSDREALYAILNFLRGPPHFSELDSPKCEVTGKSRGLEWPEATREKGVGGSVPLLTKGWAWGSHTALFCELAEIENLPGSSTPPITGLNPTLAFRMQWKSERNLHWCKHHSNVWNFVFRPPTVVSICAL